MSNVGKIVIVDEREYKAVAHVGAGFAAPCQGCAFSVHGCSLPFAAELEAGLDCAADGTHYEAV